MNDNVWKARLEVAKKLRQLEKPSPVEIRAFCRGCDNLNEDGVCPLNSVIASAISSLLFERPLGWTDQERYIHRKWCGYARVDGVRGQMTGKGFGPLGEDQ